MFFAFTVLPNARLDELQFSLHEENIAPEQNKLLEDGSF